MTVDEVQVDSDDFDFDLMGELEASLGVKFPKDLTHVRTAGDLFEEVMKQVSHTGEGTACASAMAFYLLRRKLGEFGLDEKAKPGTRLRGQTSISPHKFRKLMIDEQIHMPGTVVSWLGCGTSLAICLVGLAGLYFGAPVAVVVAAAFAALVAMKLDRGSWSREWETLGQLARAVANRNVEKLCEQGARSSRADRWRAYVGLLSEYASVGSRPVAPDEIGPETRFQFT